MKTEAETVQIMVADEAAAVATSKAMDGFLEESEEKQLDVKQSHPPEDKENKRKTRRGTRGKGRKIIYNKEKHPDDKLDGQIKTPTQMRMKSSIAMIAPTRTPPNPPLDPPPETPEFHHCKPPLSTQMQ
ncbi:hypothetical protein SRHO_G00258410 [Serrasalmus rhombeus]